MWKQDREFERSKSLKLLSPQQKGTTADSQHEGDILWSYNPYLWWIFLNPDDDVKMDYYC